MKMFFNNEPTCPKCGCYDIEGDFVEIGSDNDGQYAWQKIQCCECGYKYVDVYYYHHSEEYEE